MTVEPASASTVWVSPLWLMKLILTMISRRGGNGRSSYNRSRQEALAASMQRNRIATRSFRASEALGDRGQRAADRLLQGRHFGGNRQPLPQLLLELVSRLGPANAPMPARNLSAYAQATPLRAEAFRAGPAGRRHCCANSVSTSRSSSRSPSVMRPRWSMSIAGPSGRERRRNHPSCGFASGLMPILDRDSDRAFSPVRPGPFQLRQAWRWLTKRWSDTGSLPQTRHNCIPACRATPVRVPIMNRDLAPTVPC